MMTMYQVSVEMLDCCRMSALALFCLITCHNKFRSNLSPSSPAVLFMVMDSIRFIMDADHSPALVSLRFIFTLESEL